MRTHVALQLLCYWLALACGSAQAQAQARHTLEQLWITPDLPTPESVLYVPHKKNPYLFVALIDGQGDACLLYTSPSPRDKRQSRMPSSA